ncbi:MAG TPA: hypothetical protein RMH85_33510 [Polyangiaceae bacterium LLY-WYZ-15_(1-7)]|nr:hypothetical protein [Myxococcales bacterium]MAT24947.1 hypothetical protein [Sandaracinus sp.]HJK89862.1 hypothetical protein [Polyangiaceae bacterium LLY-WYZ-15_(1-7)]MBJ72664.1 hypothetical protein [Sandaracinus sp.]HJL06728.1 hypothetical protein [Polyangiaceae bacterium LLY-WYZ-15_(1-7)]
MLRFAPILGLALLAGCFDSFELGGATPRDAGPTIRFDAAPAPDGGVRPPPPPLDAGSPPPPPSTTRQETVCLGSVPGDLFVVGLEGEDVSTCGSEPERALAIVIQNEFIGDAELPIEPGLVDAARCVGGDCVPAVDGRVVIEEIRRGRFARLSWDMRLVDGTSERGEATFDRWCERSCEAPRFLRGRAAPTCGPADGPAWRFELTEDEAFPGCGGELPAPTLEVTVFDELEDGMAGRLFEVGGFGLDSGSVRLCDESGCVDAFEGTIEVIFFARGEVAIVAYQVILEDGREVVGETEVTGWCEGDAVCG